MKQVLLSVIVPVYRVEMYLERCLNSLLAQDFKDVEFLLIDDGSPDSCGLICDKYASIDPRFRSFHKKNGGLSSARNYGINKAQGKYLMFVDSDDWVAQDFCSVAYNLAVEKDVDLVMFSYQVVTEIEDEAKTIKCVKEGYKSWQEGIDLILGPVGVYAWNKLYRKSLFDNIRYPEGRLFEDQPVTLKLIYNAQRVYYVPKVLYYYFMRKDSIIHQKSIKSTRDWFEMKEMLYTGLEEIGYSSDALADFLPQAALFYAMSIVFDPNDQTGIRVHEILHKLQRIPRSFTWKQKVMLFLYMKNTHLFDYSCILGRKRVAS